MTGMNVSATKSTVICAPRSLGRKIEGNGLDDAWQEADLYSSVTHGRRSVGDGGGDASPPPLFSLVGTT